MRDDIDNRIADAHDIDRSRTHLNKAPGGSEEGGGRRRSIGRSPGLTSAAAPSVRCSATFTGTMSLTDWKSSHLSGESGRGKQRRNSGGTAAEQRDNSEPARRSQIVVGHSSHQ